MGSITMSSYCGITKLVPLSATVMDETLPMKFRGVEEFPKALITRSLPEQATRSTSLRLIDVSLKLPPESEFTKDG